MNHEDFEDGSGHVLCGNCGFCVDCNDCEKYRCGSQNTSKEKNK